MQWLKEIFRPRLKCRRVGHRPKEETRRTYRRPEACGSVVDGCREKRTVCGRCREVLSGWEVTDREGYQSATLPSEMWDELKHDGVVVR